MENKKTSIALPVISGALLLAVVAMLVWVVVLPPGVDSESALPPAGGSAGASVAEAYPGISALYVETGSADIRVTASGDGDVHIRYPESFTVTAQHDAESGLLSLQVTDDGFDLFSFGRRAAGGALELAVPEIYVMELNTRGGGIRIDEAKAQELYANSESGDIDAENLNVESYIALGATSGNVTCANFYTASIAAGTTSGNIALAQAYAGEISLNSSSGGQSLRAEMGAVAYFYTNSGDVDVECREPLKGWARTTSGDVAVRMPAAPQKVTFTTRSGSAHMENSAVRETEDAVYDGLFLYEIEPGGPALEVYTESGSLTIR